MPKHIQPTICMQTKPNIKCHSLQFVKKIQLKPINIKTPILALSLVYQVQ